VRTEQLTGCTSHTGWLSEQVQEDRVVAFSVGNGARKYAGRDAEVAEAEKNEWKATSTKKGTKSKTKIRLLREAAEGARVNQEQLQMQ
jgi:hypothetical protein